jgi:hypothetical protein
LLSLVFFILGTANPAPPAWATSSVTFLQGTVVAADAAARTFTFVDASGRDRSHAVAGAAAAKVRRLRAGDEVIVVLSGSEAVVQDVRRSQARPAPPTAPAASADPPAGDAGSGTGWTVQSAPRTRPSWPNPYSRYYRGPRPAPKPDPRR